VYDGCDFLTAVTGGPSEPGAVTCEKLSEKALRAMLFLQRRPSNGPCEPRAVNDGRHFVIKAFSPKSFFTYLMLNNHEMMTLTHVVNFLFYCTIALRGIHSIDRWKQDASWQKLRGSKK